MYGKQYTLELPSKKEAFWTFMDTNTILKHYEQPGPSICDITKALISELRLWTWRLIRYHLPCSHVQVTILLSHLPVGLAGVGRIADLVHQRAEVRWLRRAAPPQYELAVAGLDMGQVDWRTGLHCREGGRHLGKPGGRWYFHIMRWKLRVFIQ